MFATRGKFLKRILLLMLSVLCLIYAMRVLPELINAHTTRSNNWQVVEVAKENNWQVAKPCLSESCDIVISELIKVQPQSKKDKEELKKGLKPFLYPNSNEDGKSETPKNSQPVKPNEQPSAAKLNSSISLSSNNKAKPDKAVPKTSKSKQSPTEKTVVQPKKVAQTPSSDFSRLDLLALEDDSIDAAWNKQTEMEKKVKYQWRKNASDPIPQRPPVFHEIKKNVMWVCSAFFVPANKERNATVRGLGLAHKDHIHKYHYVYCHLLKGAKPVLMVKGNMSAIPDSHKRPYTALWMDCPLPPEFEPDSVTFTAFLNESLTSNVQVIYPGKKLLRNFTVCHSVLYGPFDQPQLLVHAWEIYRVLGADHIYVYNNNVSYRTERVFQAYEQVGILTVLPWDNYPSNLAHYRSQLIAVNDCVYRNRNVSKYVFVHDTDEIIVPHINYTGWHEMVKFLENKWNKKGPEIAAYGVQSSFFCGTPLNAIWQNATKEYNISKEEDSFMHKHNVKPIIHVAHGSTVFKYTVRSKNLIKPEGVATMGIHFPWAFEPGYRLQALPSREAIVFHQRKSCKWVKNLQQIDFRILHYLKPTYERLKRIYNQIRPSSG